MEDNTISIVINDGFAQSDDKKKIPARPHDGKKIDQIIVSQDMSYLYVVTYSREDDSICGWTGLEKDGQQLEKDGQQFEKDEQQFEKDGQQFEKDEQQFGKDGQQFEKNEKLEFDKTYIKLNEPNYIVKFVLYKKILLYRYVYFDSQNFKYGKYHYLKICLNKKISISN
jgi:hypothetical protein